MIGCGLISKGVFALFGTHTMSTLNTLLSFSATFRIPYITIGSPVRPTTASSRRSSNRDDVTSGDEGGEGVAEEGRGFQIFMKPMYAKAIADLLIHYDCNEIFYIYNSNEGKLH